MNDSISEARCWGEGWGCGYVVAEGQKSKNSDAGTRTPVSCVRGKYAHHLHHIGSMKVRHFYSIYNVNVHRLGMVVSGSAKIFHTGWELEGPVVLEGCKFMGSSDWEVEVIFTVSPYRLA